ncbi:MAG: ABC transporter ATP-binding protein [Spirochaetaceae bacterium]|nr:ABC transporter ATP-binding protein [Spirochaetaceae bacterium]
MIGSDVTIEGVSKTFGGGEAGARVLNNVRLQIKQGEFFSLLGPSGCGKTTLLRIIAGFETPDCGTVTLAGKNVLGLAPNKRQVNTVFQNYALFPHLTVFENVAFSLRLKKTPEAEVQTKVGEYLHLVELEQHAGKKPNMLSGGQKQRVAIARALINEPRVLLLDEPLSALDAKLRQHMLIELDQIHDRVGITFIYVTHDQNEALSVSDRIAVMNHGNVLQVGSPHEIYESPATDFVAKFIGETNLFDATVVSCEPYTAQNYTGHMVELDIPPLGRIKVTKDEPIEPGARVSFTIRPEKVVISTEKPAEKRGEKDINIFHGIVDEPIYSGFQTKYYVRTDENVLIRVMQQHARYSDDGPDIVWKDEVWVSWAAADGFIVMGEGDGK